MKNALLSAKIGEYITWRTRLKTTISHYRDWLATSPQTDSVKELRLHDMVEKINQDKLILTFLADDSRGKTETINALFFSDLGFNILPKSADKHSTWSTEIQWNEKEEPYISLLPISTRTSDDTLAYLKTTPSVWERYKLNVDSPKEMQAVLNKLSEQREISRSEAVSLGLWDATSREMVESLEKTGSVKISAWRHAVINYPHPALKGGLVIIDTPGLDQLHAEPELTLSMIPKADAAIFLTSADTEVSANDVNTWHEQIKSRVRHKFVLLNKIDVLWDKQQPPQNLANDINRLVNVAAHKLRTAPDNVYPVSAQQALIAKKAGDADLLAKSKILAFESILGDSIVQAKQEMYGRSIANEVSVMIKQSRKFIHLRKVNLESQINELKALQGKNADKSQEIIKQVVAEKKRYEATIPSFNSANDKITRHGEKLIKHLSVDYLDYSIEKSRQEIGDSWTTAGLNKGMRNVMKQANELAERVTQESKKIKKLADKVYHAFHEKHGFELIEAPELDMSHFLNRMHELEKVTDNFCKDPINVMTEKRFLVRRFFLGLGTQKQKIFEQARKNCEHWLLDVLSTLKSQMAEHKKTLDERMQNLMQANDSVKKLDAQLATLERQHVKVSKEQKAIDEMLLHIVSAMQPAEKVASKAKKNKEEPLGMPELLPMSNAG